ncbi:DUF4252 domain-containing protein [Epilithonimonas arachidiradicis]|uniref:Uncharacterized protein DUF4252 n=1 Tax=Epilithonimonas arachidiradicis TaxID=1617282 RepID=A0A420DEH8_9FLAO|nr:DUF4252 domain-containing protein [Epilithonimonas arachidiradicis]RKE90193.1 uncharacterized protein DUF4252 [Epilithonimonas arachidiradicis]GGG48448.1 hypothetical protein GCM10007332_07480 [Epilithonimonas arachidiradicis]
MKKISIFIVLFLLSTNIFGQTEELNKLFDKYQDTEGVTSIKIAKPMFKLLNNLKIDDEELGKIQPLLGKVNGLKMLVLEKSAKSDNPLVDEKKIEKEIANSLKNMKYEELVTVNNRDAKIKFMAQDITSNVMDNLILNIMSEDSSVLMMLDGKISMEDVNNLMQETKNVSSLNPVSTIKSDKTNVGSVRDVPAFNGIETSSGVDVEFSQSPKQSVVVKVEPEKQQYVITEVENGVLKIFVRNKGVKNLNFNSLKVIVSGPKLSRLVTKSGSSFKAVTPVNETNFAASCTSGSQVSGDFKISTNTALEVSSGVNVKMNLETKSLALEASSGSSIKLAGKADSGVYSASSGSSISANDFVTKSAVVDASSGANVKINTTESLTASASSASSIQYRGNPSKVSKSAQEVTGASITSIN